MRCKPPQPIFCFGPPLTLLAIVLMLSCDTRRVVGQNTLDTFAPNANGNIRVMAAQSDGSVIIGGEFTTVNGTNRNRIARLNPDGTLDTTFNPGANNWVLALAVQTDGKIVVAGGFTTLGGGGSGLTNRSHIGRLNNDGSIDNAFDPGANDWVWSLALTSSETPQKILVGGLFTKLGGGGSGVNNRSHLGCLQADGTIDPSFNLGAGDQINTFLVQSDGKVLVGGFFTTLAGVNRQHIGRLKADGTLDTGFNPGANNTVWKLAPEPLNTVLMAGSFTTAGGTNRGGIARLNLDGSIDPIFNPAAVGTINSVVVQLDNRIVVGGGFTSIAGTNTANMARLNIDGTIDSTLAASPNNTVQSLLLDYFGRVVVGGAFTTISGQSRSHLARVGLQTNDNFTNATVLIGEHLAIAGSTKGASREMGEPVHANISGSASSVWFKWTAPGNRVVKLDLALPNGILAVYTGSSLSNLLPIASDSAFGTPASKATLQFNASSGIIYWIAVAEYYGNDFVLQLDAKPTAPPPINDNFAAALPIVGMSNSVTGNNSGATLEPGEGLPHNSQYVFLGGSVWWYWTPTSSVFATLNTSGSSFDTDLTVYTGDSVTNLMRVADSDDLEVFTSAVTFSAQAGTTYRIAVYGTDASSGQVVLNLATTPFFYSPAPANDNFADAIVISGTSNVLTGSTLGATLESGEFPRVDVASGATVWWSFTAPANGVVDLRGDGSSIPVVLSVYQGSIVSNLTNLVHNYQRDAGGALSDYFSSGLKFQVNSGETYYISADGANGSQGDYRLGVFFTPAPTNDNFADRVPIAPGVATVTGSTLGATREAAELLNPFPIQNNSVWWSWTPTQSQSVVFTTFGSGFDTFLSVYTNSILASLSLVASNNDAFTFPTHPDPSSRVRIDAVANRTYQIAVSGGSMEQSGDVVLNLVTVALDNILAFERIVQLDRSVDFNVSLSLRNYRSVATGPLRIRLVARAGYSCAEYLARDPAFVATLNVPDEELAIINLSPGIIGGGALLQTTILGHCPAPVEEGKWGFGWAVIAVLEEQIGGVWQTQDGRVIVFGEWPAVGGTPGPAGGVTVIVSGVGGTSVHPARLQINVGPPAAVRLGGAWRVSPTNCGQFKELRFYTNYSSSTAAFLVQTTNFSIDLTNLAGFNSPSNRTIALVGGYTTNLVLFYSVIPPRMLFDRVQGLGMTGTVGTAYRIDLATQLTAQTAWTTVTNGFTLKAGTNRIPNTAPGASRANFYRSFWLTN
jgi:uncharacterized delta-60 repeat protein